jgi:hypothetical protein
LHATRIKPGVHPITIQLDLMQPVGSFRGLFDEGRELRLDPGWRVIGTGSRCDAMIA